VHDEEAFLDHATLNFSRVMTSLIEILDVLGQLKFTETEIWFRTATQDYAVELINRVDCLSKKPRPPYAPVLFPDWSNPVFLDALFDIQSEEGLRNYLLHQRQRVAYLAFNYALPPISYLTSTEYAPLKAGDADTLVKWRATLEQLEKRRRKDPAGHVQILEKVFHDTLPRRTEDCNRQPIPLLAGHENVFAISEQVLVARIEGYCQR